MNKNNFDGVRIGLALIVVFAHLAVLTQLQDFKIFEKIFDANFAVKGFFAISGFLVIKSYLSSKSLYDYAEKRFRRIYPAYITAVLLCLLIGIFTTRLNVFDFLQSGQTARYIASNAFFLNFLQPALPSTFTENPVQTLNGSLWTIKIEVMLYFCIPPIFFLFNKAGSAKTTMVLLCLSILWVYFFTSVYAGTKGDEIARQFPGQLSYFVIGALLAVNEKISSQLKWIAIGSLVLLFSTNNAYVKLIIDPACYSAVVIFLSTAAFKGLNAGKYGDISYGIYLYHFPIIQLLIFLRVFDFNVWMGFCATFLITIMLALASWHLIEKRFLKRSSHYVLAAKS